MPESDPAFFGYGSLVNLATHGYADPCPARLTGWRRVWRSTTLREAAFLSVDPAPGVTLDGIAARVPGADWLALDAREAAYTRIDVSETLGLGCPAAVYRVSDGLTLPTTTGHMILRSYLDVVVQGYFRVFGPTGVSDFFDTTTGWEVGIKDDRAAPLYPRAQTLSDIETAQVDHHLRRLSVPH
ncbi:gamma-glutamylcyclotransferase family protein [Loktanella sp. M215]|uniref:gamma-glutamylcyclotransferase family protein n=1 Tax=Loktanella sp. M215 TaxID=2675431 RepID=UPI001F40AFB5|nr:gamma-glutamylcyclotransferase [Loktanella sp. M215]